MNITGADFLGGNSKSDLGVWKRKMDEMRNKSKAKKDHLLQLQDKQRELNKESLDINSDDNP